jgi:hypothetical protein
MSVHNLNASPSVAVGDSEKPPVQPWIAPKVTNEDVEWADILTVDLSLYETHKEHLVNTVATALQRDGFFYVIGHGIPGEVVIIREVCVS